MSDERRGVLEARERWLIEAMSKLNGNIRTAPLMLVGLLLVIPVGLIWGALASAVLIFSVVMIAGATVYVAWSHLHECEEELGAVRKELRAAAKEEP
ncbi:MAG: hypothetical protein R3A52_04650 [Polyangiales bacterium]